MAKVSIGRPKGSVNTKRGIELVKKQGHNIIKGILKDIRRLEELAEQPDATKQDILDALRPKLDLVQYILPKLQAIGLGEIDSDGSISPLLARRIAEIVHLEADKPLLIESEANVLSESLAPNLPESVQTKEGGEDAV